MTEEKKQEILLESGTNEAEMIEFSINDEHFGVNVAKVKSILKYVPETVTQLPKNNGKIKQLIMIQGKTVPFIKMNDALKIKEIDPPERRIVILLRFNAIHVAVLVDYINAIHRINWNDYKPIDRFLASTSSNVIGTFNPKGRDIVVLDFEKIMSDFFPESKMEVNFDSIQPSADFKRENIKIMHIDDSSTIRKLFQKTLASSGYSQIESYENGLVCYKRLLEINESVLSQESTVDDHVHTLIIDIEMPQMDGLTLCNKIRNELNWKDVTIILFSSLIDEQMIEKCRSVGATSQITKPDIIQLVKIMDSMYDKGASPIES